MKELEGSLREPKHGKRADGSFSEPDLLIPSSYSYNIRGAGFLMYLLHNIVSIAEGAVQCSAEQEGVLQSNFMQCMQPSTGGDWHGITTIKYVTKNQTQ